MFSDEEVSQSTEAFEKLPRVFDRRNAVSERRQQILQQKQTDALPSLVSESSTPAAKAAMRQVIQLREDNRRLRSELDDLRNKLEASDGESQQWQQRFESEVHVIHNGHQQELAHFQAHLQDAINERNQLQVQYAQLYQQQQELSEHFIEAVDTEIQARLRGLSQELKIDSEKVSTRELESTLQLSGHRMSDSDRHMAEARLLKREAQRMVAVLEKERQQLQEERQQLAALQLSIREQAAFRAQTVERRLYARWRVASIGTALGLLALLVILQLTCLSLFHFASMTMVILAPILVCIVLAFVLVNPLMTLKHVYMSLPHRTKTR